MALSTIVKLCGCVSVISAMYTAMEPSKFGSFKIRKTKTSHSDVFKKANKITQRLEKTEETSGENKDAIEKLHAQLKTIEHLVSDKMIERNKQVPRVRVTNDNQEKENDSESSKHDKQILAVTEQMEKVVADTTLTKSKVETMQKIFDQFMEATQMQITKQCLELERQLRQESEDIVLPNAKLEDLVFSYANGSTTYREKGIDFYAGNAIDGHTDSVFLNRHCTHTDNGDPSPWWQGTLKVRSELHRVILTNRNDCCADRLRHFSIEAFEEDPLEVKDSKSKVCKKVERVTQHVTVIECDHPVVAKHIRISKHNTEVLTLCEVEALGYTLPKKQQMVAAQSSRASSTKTSGANLAIDGYPETCSETQSESKSDHWWELDLRETEKVIIVNITNRNDKKHTWLSNIEVLLYETKPSTCLEVPFNVCVYFDAVGGRSEVVTLKCDPPVTGRYLRIKKSGQNGEGLSLCEVSIKTEN